MLQATGTRYLIQAEDLSRTTASGIIVKETTDTQLARIVAVGPRVVEPEPVGTRIVVEWKNSVPIKHEDQQFFVIDYRSVIAVMESDHD